jgi:hypothetical protein
MEGLADCPVERLLLIAHEELVPLCVSYRVLSNAVVVVCF